MAGRCPPTSPRCSSHSCPTKANSWVTSCTTALQPLFEHVKRLNIGGTAFDDTAHDRWPNRVYPCGVGLELRLEAFEQCTEELLSQCIAACRTMRASIDDLDWEAVFVHLMAAVMMPPFELLAVDQTTVVHQQAQSVIDLLARPSGTS